MTRKATKQQSKKAYLAKRKARVRELYIHARLEPRDIAAKLVHDGTIETTDESLESAVRLVREDVRELREQITRHRSGDADATVAFDEIDALEYELSDLRSERDRQKRIADGEPDENGKEAVLIVTMMGAEGEPFQFEKPKWPAGVRQKAGKDAAQLTKDISKLEVALAEKRRLIAEAAKRSGGDKGKAVGADDVFTIHTSGDQFDDLVARNAGGEPN